MAQKLSVLLLFLPLLAAIIPIYQPVSAADTAQWMPVNIPTEGVAGKWTLAAGSDIRCLTMANDGTLYCYANPSGTTSTLFKSTDAGRSWTTTGKVSDVIVDIAISPQDSSNVYYATTSRIYKSTDAGSTFTPLPPNPGGAGSGTVAVTSIDVVNTGNAIPSLSAQLILMPRNTAGSIFWMKARVAAPGSTLLSGIMNLSGRILSQL